jgi:hypothetical protein
MMVTFFTEHRRWSSTTRWIMLCVFNAVLVSFMLQILMPTFGRYLWIFGWLFIFLIPTNILQWLLAVSILQVNQKWLRLGPWIILSFIGSYVGSLLISPVSQIYSGQEWEPVLQEVELFITIFWGTSLGVGIGIGQWLCLPARRANFWWIIVNTIGFVVAYGLYELR